MIQNNGDTVLPYPRQKAMPDERRHTHKHKHMVEYGRTASGRLKPPVVQQSTYSVPGVNDVSRGK